MNILSIKFFSFYAKNKLGMRFFVDEFKNWETFCENFSAIFLKQNLATNGDSFAFVSNGNEKYKKLLNKVIAPVGKGSFTMATIKMLRLTLIM